MNLDTMIETVRKAFAEGATPAADKQAGANVLRIALQVLEAQPGQPLAPAAAAMPAAAATPAATPKPDVFGALLDHFMGALPVAEQERIRSEVADDMIPMIQVPLL